MPDPSVPQPRTLRLAHRGDWRAAPENSLAAMEAALRIPACDGLEFDVRSSADGVAVLLHDETLSRVQGLPVACVALTAAQLADHGVPTLAGVLAAIGDEPFLDVELKEQVPNAIHALEAARGAIDAGGRPTLGSAVVSSFHPEILGWLADQRPTWPRWLNALDLSGRTIDQALELGCAAISVAWQAIDEESVAQARAAGLELAAWTIRDLAAYRRVEALGALAICTEAAALDG